MGEDEQSQEREYKKQRTSDKQVAESIKLAITLFSNHLFQTLFQSFNMQLTTFISALLLGALSVSAHAVAPSTEQATGVNVTDGQFFKLTPPAPIALPNVPKPGQQVSGKGPADVKGAGGYAGFLASKMKGGKDVCLLIH